MITEMITVVFLWIEFTRNNVLSVFKAQGIFLAFAAIFLMQSMSLFAVQGLHIYANKLYEDKCLARPFETIRQFISPNGKVITINSLVFYSVRTHNEVYFPASLSGVTVPGGVPFQAKYDASFHWLITDRPLEKLETFGVKFSWNDQTFNWFRNHYTFVTEIGDPSVCRRKYPLTRFSYVNLPIYIYSSND